MPATNISQRSPATNNSNATATAKTQNCGPNPNQLIPPINPSNHPTCMLWTAWVNVTSNVKYAIVFASSAKIMNTTTAPTRYA